jgi:sigma-E factor negative regulatory protein RseB
MRYVALIAVLMLPQVAWSQQGVEPLLKKMTHAVQSLNYTGTFVFMRGDVVDTMRIIHGRDDQGVRERLISLTGEAREFIRDQGLLTCVWPHRRAVVVENTRDSRTIPTDTDSLDDYYRFEVEGMERIAGSACRSIAIKPKDALRYGQWLCVAKDSGIPLGSAMLNASGAPVEKVMFTSINLLKTIPDWRFEPTMIEEHFIWQKVGAGIQPYRLTPDPGWRIKRIPPGFKVTDNSKRVIAGSPEPVQHLILSDGLASVSVFIANPEDRSALVEGITRSGALNAFAREVNDYQITVVGDVPEETVEMIGQSIVYRRERADH